MVKIIGFVFIDIPWKSYRLDVIAPTSKPADYQKIGSLLGASLLKQSESLQCKFLWESLLVQLTSKSLAVQDSAT